MPAAGAPAASKCLFIQGSDGDPVRGPDGRVGLLGNNDLNLLIGDPRVPLVQLTPAILRRSSLPVVTSYLCLINQISDADRNRRMLEHLGSVLAGFKGRIVNHPTNVLNTTRDRVATRLSGVSGLRTPKVARLRGSEGVEERIEAAHLGFPIIMREAGTHGGRIVGLFNKIDDLRGSVPEDVDLFATEFVDYQSADGFYRKYRVCVLGRSIILRHMIVADGWNVHGRDRRRIMLQRPDLRDEERALLESPRDAFAPAVVETLGAIRKRMPLDYFGIDFGIGADGAVVLFEANATMEHISPIRDPEFDYTHQVTPLLRRAALAMIPELSSIARPEIGSAKLHAGATE